MIRDLAIDLGTTKLSILGRNQGVILSEPSVLARVAETGEVVAIGNDAAQMIGRTPEGLEAIRPLRGGAIVDLASTEEMIRAFLKRAGVRRVNRPRIVVCVPSSMTPVEQRAVREAIYRAGASEVELLGSTMAAALGAGLPLDQPEGSMVLDIGGGTTEAAVVSLSGTVALEFARLGGGTLDADIRAYVNRRHGIIISATSAEQLKMELGTAWPPAYGAPPISAAADLAASQPNRSTEAVVRGRQGAGGSVVEVALTAIEVADAIYDSVMSMVDVAVTCLGWAPPEIANDLIENGIHLVGGGSLLDGLCARVAAHTKVPVRLVENPTEVVVAGAGRCLGMFSELEGFFLADQAAKLTGNYR